MPERLDRESVLLAPTDLRHSPGGSRRPQQITSEFEWPPPDEILDSQVVGATSLTDALSSSATALLEDDDDSRVTPKTGAGGRAFQSRLETPASTPPARERGAEARVADRRGPHSLPSSIVVAAVFLLALIASFEGVYILRMTPTHAERGSSTPSTPATPSAGGTPGPGLAAQPDPSTFARDRIADAVPTTGTILVRSDPSGVQVVLDGRSRGVTPLMLTRVGAGEHRLALRQGTDEVRQTVRVNPGATVSVVAPFKTSGAASGWLTISSPIELDILEGGVLLGTTRSRQIMMPAGAHTLDFVSEKYAYRGTEQVDVEAGGRTPIAVRLPLGSLRVNAKPWAEVWIDGERAGETPMGDIKLPIGDHQITFRHPQLGERTVTATITTREAARVTADLESGPAPRR